MAKRTYTKNVEHVETADDVEEYVADKRQAWRATKAKARRRQRRYKRRLTNEFKNQFDTCE